MDMCVITKYNNAVLGPVAEVRPASLFKRSNYTFLGQERGFIGWKKFAHVRGRLALSPGSGHWVIRFQYP